MVSFNQIMNLLRIVGIAVTVIILIAFFVSAEILKEFIDADAEAEKPNFENPFLPFAFLFLFGLPPSIACIVVSFVHTIKRKIIVSCVIIGVSYIAIFIIAFLMLEYPTIFGIPETYWVTDE